MKIISSIIILMLVAVSFGAADGVYEQQAESVRVTARGADQNEALYYALNHAVSKVNGVALSPAWAYITHWDVTGGRQRVPGGVVVDEYITQTEMSVEYINHHFQGYIKTYDIVEAFDSEGFTELTVDVEVFKYIHPFDDSTDKRARITVNEFGGDSIFADHLLSSLNKNLSSTRKFNLLDRTYFSDFAAERNIMLSDDASIADKARLAMVSGTDLMISGNVTEFRLRDALRNHSSNRRLGLYEARVKVDYSLIVPATLQTRISDTIEFTLPPEKVRSLYEVTTIGDLDIDQSQVRAKIADMVAEKIVDKVTDYAYPVLVAQVDGGSVLLNEGGNRIQAGDEFEVFVKGSVVTDPQTLLELGNVEKKVGMVRVDSVRERIAQASVIEGLASDIKPGSICRAVEISADDTPKMDGFASDLAVPKFVPKNLAVVPAGFVSGGFRHFGSIKSGSSIAAEFEQHLTNSLRQTGKFQMLDRVYDEQIRNELQLILDSSPVDQIIDRLDKVTAADYLLVGKLNDFTIQKDTAYIEAASQKMKRYRADFVYDYRILEVATRKVFFAGNIDIYYDDDQIKGLIPELSDISRIDVGESRIKNELMQIAAKRVAGEITDEMFPIQVLAVREDTIAVSSGSDTLTVGQELNIYKRGETVKDPYTGAELGSFDMPIGKARVSRAQAGLAYAEVIEGDGVEVGSVCKPLRYDAPLQRRGKVSPMKRTPTGGVYLPMD